MMSLLSILRHFGRPTLPGACVALACFAFAVPANAAIVFVTDPTVFNALTGTLTIETFEEAADNVPADSFQVFDAPLSSSTSNAFFSPGDIAAGLAITQLGGNNADGLAAARGNPAGVGNYSSVVVGAPGDALTPLNPSALNLLFATPAGSIRFDAFTAVVPNATLTVEVFDAIGTLLGSSNFAVANSGPGTFVGILSTDDDISELVLTVPSGVEVIDNLGFGPVAAVPEPSTTLLMALSGLMGGGLAWRRRRTAAAKA